MLDNIERFDMNKPPKRQKIRFIGYLTELPSLILHKGKITKIDMKGVKPPYILLANHNAYMDINILGLAAFPHRLNYVVAIDGFIGRETLLRNEKIIELNRLELINKINSNQEKILKQKEKNIRGTQERFVEQAMRKEDIEDNLRMKERAKEFVRMKKLEEMEEKSKRAENVKMQKLRIYEERRKMNRSLEKDKENLLMKFNELMSQRGVKSKEEVMKQLFDGEEGLEYKTMGNNKSMANSDKSNMSKTFKKENEKIKEEDEYNDFQKEDNFFVTNLPKQSLEQAEPS